MKAGESSRDWFGKKGRSLLGCLLNVLIDGSVASRYIDMIVDGPGDQDVMTSMSLLEALIHHVIEEYPHIKKIYLVSDNGSHFSSFDMIYWMDRINQRIASKGVQVMDYLFSESQWGKSRLDTHFAYVKSLWRRWLAWQHDVSTPLDMFIGLTQGKLDGSGLNMFSTAILVVPKLPVIPKTHSARDMFRKVLGVRSTGHVKFHSNGDIELCELSGLEGKIVPLSGDNIYGKWSRETMKGYYEDTGTRFDSSDPNRLQRGPCPILRVSQPRAIKAGGVSALEKVIASSVDAFHVDRVAASEAEMKALRQGQNEVAFDLNLLGDVQLTREVYGAKRKGVATVRNAILPIPGAKANFGLKKGFAHRENQKKSAVDRRIIQHLESVFKLGITGSNRSPAQTCQDMVGGILAKDWKSRVLVNETFIKEKFSSWAAARKKAMKEGKSRAVESTAEQSASGPVPVVDVPPTSSQTEQLASQVASSETSLAEPEVSTDASVEEPDADDGDDQSNVRNVLWRSSNQVALSDIWDGVNFGDVSADFNEQ